MNKEQVCVIISSYTTNYLDSSLLGLTIKSWANAGYDICLVSHSPLNPDLQKSSKYYLYTDENEMLVYPEISNTTWFCETEVFKYQTNWGNTMGRHSYAILKNIQNSLYFLKSKPYTHFIYLEVDGFLNHEDHLAFESKLNEVNFLESDYWLMMEYEGLAHLPVTNFFAGRINYFYNRLFPINTPTRYMNVAIGSGGYSLESFFGEMFIKYPEGIGHIERSNPRKLFPNNNWFGISSNSTIHIPGLQNVDWWIDMVVDKNEPTTFYTVVSQSKHAFNTVLKLFRNDDEIFSTDCVTGPLVWFKVDIEPDKIYRFEQWIGNERIKHLEYTSSQIIDNKWSYMEFH